MHEPRPAPPSVLGRAESAEQGGARTARGTAVIIGLGYVGLPLAILAEEKGWRVTGFDIDSVKLEHLKRRDAPFLSEEEARFFKKSAMRITADEASIVGADVYVVCVPTPVDEHFEPDLRPLARAMSAVGRVMRPGALVAVESTVNPGVCESIAIPRLTKASGGLEVERDFFFAHCPERINPGDPTWTTRTLPRVLGAAGPKSRAKAEHFYASIIEAPLHVMGSIKEAEAVKMVENSFRDVNIAFVNELAMSFDKAGIDIVNVIRGASTKPFSFMPHFPGCGVGGHCIPVDPYYLIRYGRENGFEHRFLVTARAINQEMPAYTVDILERAFAQKKRGLAGRTIALLGLAYKRDVPDLRESPALEIRHELIRRGAEVRTFDPFVPERSSARTLDGVLEAADAALIATDHTLFRTLSPETFRAHGITVVIDGRNCLPKEAFLAEGIDYRGIGR